jgi:hypothetical protein
MMQHPITVTIAPETTRVRILATQDGEDILKAVLGPASSIHPRAAATLLEGLALWYRQSLSVVLCVDGSDDSSALGLYDGLGYGSRQLHYEVGVAARTRRPRRRRPLDGLGDFRDLRQMSLSSEWSR